MSALASNDAGRRTPGVQISSSYPGASPEQVENDISKPVESAVNTVAGVKRILSRSDEGRSFTGSSFGSKSIRRAQRRRSAQAGADPRTFRATRKTGVQRGGSENDQPVASFVLVGSSLTQLN